MRCLLIIRNPSMPDIVFIWSDMEFKKHIAKSAMERGLLNPDEVNDDLDLSVVTQYFSPIIASHGLMSSEMNCPYSSITCNNGFIFVIKQFSEHLYITVNGDGQETEQFLHKKLLVFHRIVQFFFGPSTEQLRQDNLNERDNMWNRLGSILDSWCDLYHTNQSFLLEALERLTVNHTLSEYCIGQLKSVILKFQAAGDKNAVHAIFITGAKVLSLYSSPNKAELQFSDVLLIINLVRSLYPAADGPLQEEDPPPKQDGENRLSGVLSDGEFLSAGEGGVSDGSNYYSPTESNGEGSPQPSDAPEQGERPSTSHAPKLQSSQRQRSGDKSTSSDSRTDSWCDLAGGSGADMSKIPSVDFTPKGRIPDPPISNTIWYTPIEDSSRDEGDDDESARSTGRSRGTTPDPVRHPRHSTSSSASASSLHPSPVDATPTSTQASMGEAAVRGMEEKEEDAAGGMEDAVQVNVFLQQSCPYSPHTLHIIHILPSIVLVVVSEINNQVAICVHNCLVRLNNLTNALSRSDMMGEALHKQSSVGKLDADIKQLGNAIKKLRISGLQQVHTDLLKLWTIAKGSGLTTSQGTGAGMALRLESTLSEMSKVLKTIFQRRYISRNTPLIRSPLRYQSVISDVGASLAESLVLYHEYLAVKAGRNTTMTNYLEEFPGLVHFAHVNRSKDELYAPSINVSTETEHAGVERKLLHEKVWSMVERCHEQLQQGFVVETVRQGDFTLSYCLYFEDPNGPVLASHGLPRTTKTPVPGIFAGKFFKEVVDYAFPETSAVSCCELFCIHLSVVPMAMVASQVRRLRMKLRSSDPITPVNLL
ncbi:BLOC-3 complex member HPS1-like [Diadema setosum]|uniref:BLOC-3 complex member HPS1-like n=1 Tax=Diadema setosum TaxID=31175 RepID=UPI003B3B20BC